MWPTYNCSPVAVFIEILINVLRPGDVIRNQNIWVLAFQRHISRITSATKGYAWAYAWHSCETLVL